MHYELAKSWRRTIPSRAKYPVSPIRLNSPLTDDLVTRGKQILALPIYFAARRDHTRRDFVRFKILAASSWTIVPADLS